MAAIRDLRKSRLSLGDVRAAAGGAGCVVVRNVLSTATLALGPAGLVFVGAPVGPLQAPFPRPCRRRPPVKCVFQCVVKDVTSRTRLEKVFRK